MLDQNTDRMWYVIGAVLIGGLIIASSVMLFSDTVFAGVGDTFDSFMTKATNQTPNHYVLATDDDFRWVSKSSGYSYTVKSQEDSGYYKYIGDGGYVLIPNEINGDCVNNYYRMFAEYSGVLDGVWSNNDSIISTRSMLRTVNSSSSLDVSGLDTTNVETMMSMFAHTTTDTLDLSGFNVDSVEDVFTMFYNLNVEILDLSSFNLSEISGVDGMFDSRMTSFKEIIVNNNSDKRILENYVADHVSIVVQD